MIQNLVECPQFSVSKIALTDPLHIYTDKFESFIVYICLEGAASVQVPSVKENGEACMENYEISKGETILIPADMSDFYLVPRDKETVLLEAVTRPSEAKYFNILDTTSLAEPIYFAICSWVSFTVSPPVLETSSRRKMARRLSILIKSICCITHITSEKRLRALS